MATKPIDVPSTQVEALVTETDKKPSATDSKPAPAPVSQDKAAAMPTVVMPSDPANPSSAEIEALAAAADKSPSSTEKDSINAYNGRTGYYDTTTAEQNCAQLNHCSDHGICFEGQCVCDMSWTGDMCNLEIKSCPLECAGHGLCDNLTGKCFCNLGWTGTGCNNVDESVARKGQVEMEQKEEKSGVLNLASMKEPHANTTADTEVRSVADINSVEPGCDCSGNGFCIDKICVCDQGYDGKHCEIAPKHVEVAVERKTYTSGTAYHSTVEDGKGCPKNCNGRGRCNLFGVCQCDDGYGGRDCSVEALVLNLLQEGEGTGDKMAEQQGPCGACGSHGLCVMSTCMCDLGFSGSDCNTESAAGTARGSSDKAYWQQPIKQVWTGKAGNAANLASKPKFDNVFGAMAPATNLYQAFPGAGANAFANPFFGMPNMMWRPQMPGLMATHNTELNSDDAQVIHASN